MNYTDLVFALLGLAMFSSVMALALTGGI